MSTQRCARCKREEYIPTHQFVKFDLKVHYLCSGCWERFRRWMIVSTAEHAIQEGGVAAAEHAGR